VFTLALLLQKVVFTLALLLQIVVFTLVLQKGPSIHVLLWLAIPQTHNMSRIPISWFSCLFLGENGFFFFWVGLAYPRQEGYCV
jgi:hypothetical protein